MVDKKLNELIDQMNQRASAAYSRGAAEMVVSPLDLLKITKAAQRVPMPKPEDLSVGIIRAMARVWSRLFEPSYVHPDRLFGLLQQLYHGAYDQVIRETYGEEESRTLDEVAKVINPLAFTENASEYAKKAARETAQKLIAAFPGLKPTQPE